ncbi:hypothetical protein D4Q85_00190 [bacterium]|nr:MAG: hypothetical protein D4Q85_00190 [bacterium]
MKPILPSDRTIKRRLRELSTQISMTHDPAVRRVSYAMECAIRWARQATEGWDSPAETARHLAVMLRKELGA